MLEGLIDIEVTGYRTIIEELEIVCCMPDSRLRLVVEHLVDGPYRALKPEPE